MSNVLLEVKGVRRTFRLGGQVLEVLRGVDMELHEGEIIAIVGQSGSGKSTLLHQIGLVDKPDAGEVYYSGERLPLSGARAAHARNKLFGFVFQFYHLLPDFTAAENVLIDEGILYAMRLLEHGVSVELHQYPGTFHGSALVGNAEVSKRSAREMTDALKRGLRR